MNDKIAELQKKIKEEEQRIADCNHEYGKPYYDHDTKRVPTGFKTVGMGSDVWLEATGYRDEEVPRWAKKCKHCGNVTYTTKQKEVNVEYAPDFD